MYPSTDNTNKMHKGNISINKSFKKSSSDLSSYKYSYKYMLYILKILILNYISLLIIYDIN